MQAFFSTNIQIGQRKWRWMRQCSGRRRSKRCKRRRSKRRNRHCKGWRRKSCKGRCRGHCWGRCRERWKRQPRGWHKGLRRRQCRNAAAPISQCKCRRCNSTASAASPAPAIRSRSFPSFPVELRNLSAPELHDQCVVNHSSNSANALDRVLATQRPWGKMNSARTMHQQVTHNVATYLMLGYSEGRARVAGVH